MSVNLRANNSDKIIIKLLSVHQRASDTVNFGIELCVYTRRDYLWNRNRDYRYVIKFLFIHLIMKYPSLKTYDYTKHVF